MALCTLLQHDESTPNNGDSRTGSCQHKHRWLYLNRKKADECYCQDQHL